VADQRRFWSDARLKRLAFSVTFAGALALLFLFQFDSENNSSARLMLTRGDFPGFYAPGVIVSRGLGERLYDPALQAQIENEAWPDFKGHFLSSVYPPYVAALLRPFAALPPLQAKGAATALLLLAFALTCTLLFQELQIPLPLRFPVVLFCATLAPIFVSILSAQNTAISMLFFLMAILFVSKGTSRGDYQAGISLGLWLFKPQFALLALAFPVVSGRYRILLGALLPAMLYWLLGLTVLGISWPSEWLTAARTFGNENFLVNGFQMVSIAATLKSFQQQLSASDSVALFVNLSTLALSITVFLITLWQFPGRAKHDPLALRNALCLAGPALTLISPQTLFYDLGIALLPCAFFLSLRSDRSITIALCLSSALFVLSICRDAFAPFPILALVSIASFLFILTRIARSGQRT
jgi:uncharacterized membrane protein (GlpM family)